MTKRQYFIYTAEVMMSLLVVCGLFWVAFFVKPTVKVEQVERFPFERRDAFYSVAALDDKEQSVCAVGSYGKVIRTDDGGVNWVIQETPTENHLQSVAAWDRQTLVAIGDKNTVLVTRDAGKHWEKVEVPSFPFGGQLLRARVDAESGRAWVAGSMGVVLGSEDRGLTWNMKHSEEDVSWNDIAVGPGDTVWVVGEFGSVEYSEDNGESWNRVTVPTEASLNAIDFSDDRHGAIVGLSGTVLVTADGGLSWELAESGMQTHLYSLLWDGRAYHAVGDDGMILSADARGQEWKAGKLSPANFAWYTGIARAGDSYYISGADVGVYSDGKWTPFEPGLRVYRKGSVNNG
jgi:photosystem II stability/assembly factor-like uncharacterized protein